MLIVLIVDAGWDGMPIHKSQLNTLNSFIINKKNSDVQDDDDVEKELSHIYFRKGSTVLNNTYVI